jgi:NADPH:quinone reductase-like Zn-dependent oxidoreductase
MAGARRIHEPGVVSEEDCPLTRGRTGSTDDRAMRALRTHTRGGPEHLVEEEAPMPAPGIGDVLVRAHAASFTPTELGWPSTWVDRAGRDRLPAIPGHEVSGVVTALGYGTTGLAVGDAVYGLTDWYRDGAAAEYVAVEARNLARKPDGIDHRAAAALPMVALTAQQALFEHGGLAAGRAVAVLGAAGGVGTFSVQLARAAGARVVALARPWANDLLRELGAEAFAEIERVPFAKMDLVFDLVGGETLRRACALVRPGATVVSAVEEPTAGADQRGLFVGRFFVVEPSRPQLQALGERVVAGELRPVVGGAWPLREGRAAFEAKHRGGQPGKAVLVVVGA